MATIIDTLTAAARKHRRTRAETQEDRIARAARTHKEKNAITMRTTRLPQYEDLPCDCGAGTTLTLEHPTAHSIEGTPVIIHIDCSTCGAGRHIRATYPLTEVYLEPPAQYERGEIWLCPR